MQDPTWHLKQHLAKCLSFGMVVLCSIPFEGLPLKSPMVLIMAASLGVPVESHLITVFRKFAPGVSYWLLTLAVVWIWEKFLWRFHPKSNYVGGDWIYSLRTEGPSVGSRSIVGRFHLEQALSAARVIHGFAYFMDMRPRLEWQSKAVAVNQETIDIIFRGIGKSPEPPPVFLGYIRLRKSNQTPIAGKRSWTGEIFDFAGSVRTGHIYAEELGHRKNTRYLDSLLSLHREKLAGRSDPSVAA